MFHRSLLARARCDALLPAPSSAAATLACSVAALADRSQPTTHSLWQACSGSKSPQVRVLRTDHWQNRPQGSHTATKFPRGNRPATSKEFSGAEFWGNMLGQGVEQWHSMDPDGPCLAPPRRRPPTEPPGTLHSHRTSAAPPLPTMKVRHVSALGGAGCRHGPPASTHPGGTE